MTEQARFDPRFNPAFQRGFDASSERAKRANQTPSLSAEDVVYGRSPRLEVPPPRVEHERDAPGSAPHDEETAAARGGNPYVLALWALSVVFVVGGLALILGPGNSFRYDGSSTGPSTSELVVMQLFAVLSPGMIIVGLATVSGLLFWHAADWKRRRR